MATNGKETTNGHRPKDGKIRVAIVGVGNCASSLVQGRYYYEKAKDGDVILDQGGIKLYVDSMSSMYLQGVTIDYVQGLQGAGFKFNNPNAKNTCGCGSSFST